MVTKCNALTYNKFIELEILIKIRNANRNAWRTIVCDPFHGYS